MSRYKVDSQLVRTQTLHGTPSVVEAVLTSWSTGRTLEEIRVSALLQSENMAGIYEKTLDRLTQEVIGLLTSH